MRFLLIGILPVAVGASFFAYSPSATGQARFQNDIAGTSINGAFGSAVLGFGDVTGDGASEIAIGAPLADTHGAPGDGLVQVYSNGTWLYDVLPSAGGEAFGSCIAAIGDLDNDTWPDFAVGAPTASPGGSGSGKVYLISGIDGSIIDTIDGPSAGDLFGTSLAGPIHLNPGTDSVPDIIIGAPGVNGDRGKFFAYLGTDLVTPFYEYEGGAVFDNLGTSVAIGGDYDTDGVPEILVGSPGWDDPVGDVGVGAVDVVVGDTGTLFTRWNGSQNNDSMGTAIVNIGDVDFDLIDDYAVAGWGASRGFAANGHVEVISGVDHATQVFEIDGEGTFHSMGFSLAAPGDIDGDGLPDLLIGAPRTDYGASDGGSVYAVEGDTGAVIYRIDGLNSDGRLGWALHNVGDLDANSMVEYALGEPNQGNGQIQLRSAQRPSFRYVGDGTIGTNLDVEIVSNALHTATFLWDLDPGPIDTPCGVFEIGFSPAFGMLGGLPLDGNGQLLLGGLIPNDPGLIGLTLYGQALILTVNAPNGKYLLSNGHSVTFQ